MSDICLILNNGMTSVAKCMAWRIGKNNSSSYVKELMWKCTRNRKSNLYKKMQINQKRSCPRPEKFIFFPSKSSTILLNNLFGCVVHQ